MNETAAQIAESLAARWEGFYATPYLCPAGVPTIGYGFTRYPNGIAVTLMDPPISKEQAKGMLQHFILRILPQVLKLCPSLVAPGRLGALTDFCFNLGVGNLRASTLRRKINAEQWDEVPTQLRRWTRAGGRILRGLVLRREAEIAYL